MPTVLQVASEKEGATKPSVSSTEVQSKSYPRVTIRLVGELEDALKEIQEATNASTPSEVVRKSLLIYHTLVKQRLAGNEAFIEIKGPNGPKRIPVFL